MATDIMEQEVVHTGLILPEHRDGMPEGWEHGLKQFREIAERNAAARASSKRMM